MNERRIVCLPLYEFAAECAASLMARRIPFRYEGKDGESYSLWVAREDLRVATDAIDTVSFEYCAALARIPEAGK